VSLSQASAVPVTLTYGTILTGSADASDYQSAIGFIVFNPGETTKTVTIKVSQDATPELDETFALQLTEVANAVVTDGWGIGTILDDDPQ
jgi:chitinase